MGQKLAEQTSTATCREEGTSKRLGRVERWSGASWTHRTVHRMEGCYGHKEGEKRDPHPSHPRHRDPTGERKISIAFGNHWGQIS